MSSILTLVSDRLEFVEMPAAAATTSFADDVASGLRAASKHLPSKYLYDELGSALFDAITKVPEYYPTRAETEILRDWGWDIVRALDAPLEFLELGSGSAVKTRLLIEEVLRVQGALRYSPIDISLDALRASSVMLVDTYPGLSIRAYAGDYFAVLGSTALQFEKRALAMFMGSNIGNYQPHETRQLLSLIAGALRPGDGLLLGTDLKKDRATLESAYDDPIGVTAAFNKNLLARINRELGADFNLANFEHVAIYDERRGSVDSFLRARGASDVLVSKLDMRVHFDEGECIHTESSYKFDDATIGRLGAEAGFSRKKTWHDRSNRFAVTLLVREGERP